FRPNPVVALQKGTGPLQAKGPVPFCKATGRLRIMTTRLAGLSAIFLAAAAIAQPNQNVLTRALEPAADDLARLNLVVAWRQYLPVENRGDAIATIQPFDSEVFVQLSSGRLIA